MSLTELRPGDMHEGMVITVNEHGCYVDFGAEKDGYVRLRVSSVDIISLALDEAFSCSVAVVDRGTLCVSVSSLCFVTYNAVLRG
eukprot:10339-Eustigmatos_ZCMA.PRE.1